MHHGNSTEEEIPSQEELVEENEENSVKVGFSFLDGIVFAVEAIMLVFIVGKTFQYIKESGKIIVKEPEEKTKYFQKLPVEGMTPGQAEILKDINFANMGDVLVASLCNMKEKGILDFVYEGNSDLAIEILQKEPTLVAEEKPIFDFLVGFGKHLKREDETIPFTAVQKFFAQQKENKLVFKNAMEHAIKKSIETYDAMADRRIKRRFLGIFVYVVLIILTVTWHRLRFDIFTLHTWIYILSVVNIIHCFRISTRTDIFDQDGVNYREKLKGLERYLKDFATSKSQGLPEISAWNTLLIDAMAFGIAPSVLRKIKLHYPNIEQTDLKKTAEEFETLFRYRFPKMFGKISLKTP